MAGPKDLDVINVKMPEIVAKAPSNRELIQRARVKHDGLDDEILETIRKVRDPKDRAALLLKFYEFIAPKCRAVEITLEGDDGQLQVLQLTDDQYRMRVDQAARAKAAKGKK